jgi:hypothetical protein
MCHGSIQNKTQLPSSDCPANSSVLPLLADRNRGVAPRFLGVRRRDRGDDNEGAEQHDDERREVDQERLGAVLVEPPALQEGQLLQEPELRGRQRQNVDEEAEERVPGKRAAPHAGRRAGEEEGHEPEHPLRNSIDCRRLANPPARTEANRTEQGHAAKL